MFYKKVGKTVTPQKVGSGFEPGGEPEPSWIMIE